MSLIKQGGTRRATRGNNPTKRVRPGDNPNDPANEGHKREGRKARRAKRLAKKPTPATPALPEVKSTDLVRSLGEGAWGFTSHPLAGMLKAWLNAKSEARGEEVPPTRRQARKFLAAHPHYRVAKAA
jgi:hypothetical protein